MILLQILQDKRKDSDHKWYGKVKNLQTLDTATLAKRIQQNVSVKESDVYAVLIELAEVMTQELSNGNKIKLDRFGYFNVRVKTRAVENKEDWNVKEHLLSYTVGFQPLQTRTSNQQLVSRTLLDSIKFRIMDGEDGNEDDNGNGNDNGGDGGNG